MTDRTLFCLYVDIYENGSWKDLRDVPRETITALCQAIESLWNPTYHSQREFTALPNEEGDILYLLYLEGGRTAAFPKDLETREITVGAPGKTLKLVGDRIPIKVPGLSRVDVQFSDV
jgi:hypothetical protein